MLKGGDVRGVILFGSTARGEERPYPWSDIDLLIIANNLEENPAKRRIEMMRYKADSILETLWLTPQELRDAVEGGWGVILDALAEGIIMLDKDGIIEASRRRVLEKYERIGRVWRIAG